MRGILTTRRRTSDMPTGLLEVQFPRCSDPDDEAHKVRQCRISYRIDEGQFSGDTFRAPVSV